MKINKLFGMYLTPSAKSHLVVRILVIIALHIVGFGFLFQAPILGFMVGLLVSAFYLSYSRFHMEIKYLRGVPVDVGEQSYYMTIVKAQLEADKTKTPRCIIDSKVGKSYSIKQYPLEESFNSTYSRMILFYHPVKKGGDPAIRPRQLPSLRSWLIWLLS